MEKRGSIRVLNIYSLLIIVLSLIGSNYGEDMEGLHEVFCITQNASVPDEYINFEQTDIYEIKDNVLSVVTVYQWRNISDFNFTQNFQSPDDRKSVFDLSIKNNGVDTNQPQIISFKKKGETYIAESKPFQVKSSDRTEIAYKMGGAVKPVNERFLFFNVTLDNFFYPFNTYKMQVTYPPAYLSIRERKVVIYGDYEIKEKRFQCPDRVGKYNVIPLVNARTGQKTNFTLNWDFDLNNKNSSIKVIEENRKITLVFEPLRTTQSALVKDYIEQDLKYDMNETNSCVFNLQYATKPPILLIGFLLLVVIGSSYIATNKYFNARTTKKRKYIESTIIYFITPVIAVYAISAFWMDRPISPTLLELSVITSYLLLSISWRYFFKYRKKNQFKKNLAKGIENKE
jgi:hypothetical protein